MALLVCRHKTIDRTNGLNLVRLCLIMRTKGLILCDKSIRLFKTYKFIKRLEGDTNAQQKGQTMNSPAPFVILVQDNECEQLSQC